MSHLLVRNLLVWNLLQALLALPILHDCPVANLVTGGQCVVEGGHRGGTILVTGTPEDVAACPQSYTGQFLARMLPSTSARPDQPAAVANKPDARPPRKVKPEKAEKPAKKETQPVMKPQVGPNARVR